MLGNEPLTERVYRTDIRPAQKQKLQAQVRISGSCAGGPELLGDAGAHLLGGGIGERQH